MKSRLKIEMSDPGTSYKATRFDWTGVFEKVIFDGKEFAGRWFDGDNPLKHDNLCGMSEEFLPIWLNDGRCLKIGVGILDVPGGEDGYDQFKLYNILDGGRFSVEKGDGVRTTHHCLTGLYNYTKTVRITGENSFVIEHHIENIGKETLSTFSYNHNFLTFGRNEVGPGRRFDFPGAVSGHWRADSTPVAVMEGNSVVFKGTVEQGRKAFCADMRYAGCGQDGYSFRASQDEMSVDVRSDAPMDYAVFWSNDRVACVEPYVKICLNPGENFDWKIEYVLQNPPKNAILASVMCNDCKK